MLNKIRKILKVFKALLNTPSLANVIINTPNLKNIINNINQFGGYTTVNISTINHGEILKGRNILITGGSTGIGLSIAKKCISEGATVVITGRDQEKLKKAKLEINSSLLKTIVWDVSQINQQKDKIQEIEKLICGNIDILVNNAGVLSGENFPNVTEDVWDNVYNVNSKGLFFLTQLLCEKWMENKNLVYKKIINISSQGGFVGATYPYRMTKWDVAGLTQGLGIKMAPYGIIVNGIAPGVIATNMQPNCLEQGENVFYLHNPVRRFALPDEIAELAIFLMSDAGNFIVGQTIVSDGGFSVK
ncbi:MAG: SDR family NAD(P)-dependent oxidoreductase [Bacteroidales bacterium]